MFALWAIDSILVTTDEESVSVPTVLALRKISFSPALILLAISFFSEIRCV